MSCDKIKPNTNLNWQESMSQIYKKQHQMDTNPFAICNNHPVQHRDLQFCTDYHQSNNTIKT